MHFFSRLRIFHLIYFIFPSLKFLHRQKHISTQEQEPKDAKTELSAELKQKVTEDRSMKQKRAKGFRGLQPQERPITLPGGRKWRNAKDAMNEEMIAEIISSQAELIMGSTLG